MFLSFLFVFDPYSLSVFYTSLPSTTLFLLLYFSLQCFHTFPSIVLTIYYLLIQVTHWYFLYLLLRFFYSNSSAHTQVYTHTHTDTHQHTQPVIRGSISFPVSLNLKQQNLSSSGTHHVDIAEKYMLKPMTWWLLGSQMRGIIFVVTMLTGLK